MVVLISAAVYPILPRYYAATADLVVQLTNNEGAPAWQQSVQFALDDNAIQTKMDITKSQPVQFRVIRKNALMNDPEFNHALDPSPWKQRLRETWWLVPWIPPQQTGEIAVADLLIRNLITKRERKSYVLQIGYESLDPTKAAALTNSLVDAFVEEDTERKRQTHNAILNSLKRRMSLTEANYRDAEEAHYRFIVRAGLDHIGDHQLWEQELQALGKQVAEAHQQAVALRAHAAILAASAKANDMESTSDVQNSQLLQKMRQRYFELSTGAGSLTAPIGANNSVAGNMRTALEAEMLRITKAATNDAKIAEIEEVGLRTEAAIVDGKLGVWETNTRQANQLQRVVDVAKASVDQAHRSYVQEISRGDVLQPDISIVSRPEVPLVPAFPSPKLYLVGTLFLVIMVDGLLMLPKLLRRVG